MNQVHVCLISLLFRQWQYKMFNGMFFNYLLVVFQGIKGSPGAYGASGDKGRKGLQGITSNSNCRKRGVLILIKGLY